LSTKSDYFVFELLYSKIKLLEQKYQKYLSSSVEYYTKNCKHLLSDEDIVSLKTAD